MKLSLQESLAKMGSASEPSIAITSDESEMDNSDYKNKKADNSDTGSKMASSPSNIHIKATNSN